MHKITERNVFKEQKRLQAKKLYYNLKLQYLLLEVPPSRDTYKQLFLMKHTSSQLPNNMHSEITVNIAHYKVNFLKTQKTSETSKHGYFKYHNLNLKFVFNSNFSTQQIGCFSASNKNQPFKEKQSCWKWNASFVLLNQTVIGKMRKSSQNVQIPQGKAGLPLILNKLIY